MLACQQLQLISRVHSQTRSLSQADKDSEKAAAAGTSIPKAKALTSAKGTAPENIKFQATVTEAMALGSDYPALLILLGNPDAFRLLCNKIPPSTAGTSPLLLYLSKMHDNMVMMYEADFMAIHGGRITHAKPWVE